MNQGQNATITINATSPPRRRRPITNTAVVDPDNTIAESNELNNTSATVNTHASAARRRRRCSTSRRPTAARPPGTVGHRRRARPGQPRPGARPTRSRSRTTRPEQRRADDVVVTRRHAGPRGVEHRRQPGHRRTAPSAPAAAASSTRPQVRCSIRSLNSGGTLTITIRGIVVAVRRLDRSSTRRRSPATSRTRA